MSTLQVEGIRNAAASSDAITFATNGTCTAKVTNNLSNRNLIINGAMICAQRSSSSTSNGYKTVDRFSHFSGGGTTTWSVGTETSGTVWEKGLRKYFRCTNTANATASGNYREITYKIENQDLMGSGWNFTSASSKLTLSFWVRASVAQTYYGRIRWMGDSGGTGDKNFVFSTGSLSANTWTKVTVSIPGLSGKTLNDGGSSADNASLFQLNWSPFQGTDGTASGVALNTWNAYAGASKYPDYTTTWGSTNGATFDLTGVQLEVDSTGSGVATDFEYRTYGDELARCQRYFYKTPYSGYYVGAGNGSTNMNHTLFHFPVAMRAQPSGMNAVNVLTITSSNYTSSNSKTPSIAQWCETGAALNWSGISGATDNRIGAIMLNGATARLEFDSEL